MRLLVIDDDVALLAVLAAACLERGHAVVSEHDGARGYARLASEPFDAVICDVNLPGLDGFTICRRSRDAGITVPIVLLTSRDGEIDEALGLDLGADDYVTKPFSVRVLLARLAALARRSGAPPGQVVRCGDLMIDRARVELRYQEQLIPATLTELRLLAALAERPGEVYDRDRLLAHAREDDSVVAPRLVDTYVARLRKKLEAVQPGAGARIETVTGAGYRWRAP